MEANNDNNNNNTVQTRILIISDTHNAPLHASHRGCKQPPYPPFQAPLPKADLLIHCGDMTVTGQPKEYNQTLEMLKTIDAPVKIVIAGNHDFSLDREYMLSHAEDEELTPDEAETRYKETREFWTSPSGRARKEGITFLDEGLHSIDLPNGARVTVYANPYTPEFCDWGFPYERDEDVFNEPAQALSDAKCVARHSVPSFAAAAAAASEEEEERQRPVDFMVTHGPPWDVLDMTKSRTHVGCPHLLRALVRARPLVHCFGHIHEGWGAERIQWNGDADSVACRKLSTEEWIDGGWLDSVAGGEEGIQTIEADREVAKERRAVFVDLSAAGGNPVRRGADTVLINAAIMNIYYRPLNAPWVVDIDLPKG